MQVTVEYDTTPPQVWLSNLRRVAANCKDFHVQVQFIEVPRVEPLLLSTAGLGTCIYICNIYIRHTAYMYIHSSHNNSTMHKHTHTLLLLLAH